MRFMGEGGSGNRSAAGIGEQYAVSKGRFSERFAGSSPKKGWERLPSTLALICAVLLAAWMGDTNGGYFVGDWASPALVLVALLLFVSGLGFLGSTNFRWSVGSTKLPWSVLALGLLATYTAWTFASLLWSLNMGNAWLGAGQTLVYLLAFWVAVALVALGASRRWALAASVLGPAVVAAFTLPALGPRLNELFQDDRLLGTVGYYNGEAAFLLVSFWVAIYLGGSQSVNPVLRGAVLAGAVLNVDLAVLTQSRGAMVAMAISVPVFFLLSGQRLRGLLALLPVVVALLLAFPGLNGVYVAFYGGGSPLGALESVLPTVWLTATAAGLYGLTFGLVDRWWRVPEIIGRIAGGVVLAGVVVTIVACVVLFFVRVDDPGELARQQWDGFRLGDMSGEEQSRYFSASGQGRHMLWQVAWENFATHPVLGIGTHNYEATYYQLRYWDANAVRQPHSLPLEVLAERGVVGGALFFGFLAVCLGVGLQERFTNLRPEGKAQVGALIAAVSYWFAHSCIEWFWQLPAVTLPVFVYLALLVSPWQRAEAASARLPTVLSRLPLRVAGVGVAVLAVAAIVPLYAADRYLKQSYEAADTAAALAAVERAQAFNPVNPRSPEREAELAMKTGDWDRAEAAYEEAIDLDPENYTPYMYRASFHERRGDLEEALLYYQQALALNPLDENLDAKVDLLQGVLPG